MKKEKSPNPKTSLRKKGPNPKKGAKRQTTAMKAKSTVDPFKGIVKPDVLKAQVRKCLKGDHNARSYVRGSLAYLERKPPNPKIVPVLKLALEKFGEHRDQ